MVKKTEEKPIEKKLVDAIVEDKFGSYVRTYSLEKHGKDFEKLAQQFAKKIEGKVK